MIYCFVYSLLLSFFIGHFLFKIFQLESNDFLIGFIHKFSLGLGFVSVAFWQYALANNGNIKYYYLFEMIVFLILAFLAYKIRREKNTHQRQKTVNKCKKMVYLAYLLLALQAILIIFICLEMPLGMWDAQSMWNLKAKFLAFGNENWTKMFDNRFDYAHRDYPMFLSSIVGRGFYYMNNPSCIIHLFYAVFFTFSCLFLLYKYLEETTNAYFGITAIIIVTSNMDFITYGSWQYADIPIALYFLISIYSLYKYANSLKIDDLKKCILFSSITPWVKNEGKVFFLAYSVMLLYFICKRYKQKAKYFICYIPVMVSIIQVSNLANCNNDLMNKITERLSCLISIECHKTIINYMFLHIPFYYIALLSFLVIYSLKKLIKPKAVSFISIPIIVNALAYYCIYLLTPNDLNWHLETSCVRIYLQLLPSALFLFFIIAYLEYKRYENEKINNSVLKS